MIENSLAADATFVVALVVLAGLALWNLLMKPVSYWRD